jgi:A/G-specific adenine glycosylase
MIRDYYHDLGRHDLPWRLHLTPYTVFISEIMLQQTQVSRVRVKYAEWLLVFPDFETLCQASVADVISAWQGLGYNRRALRLREAAQIIRDNFGGNLPRDLEKLISLPGIGNNTAGSIAAFAFNLPVTFIETNIRRVFIHHYAELASRDASPVAALSDKQLLPLIEATLDRDNPREWYWALMDYGADLVKRVENPNRQSKHYSVQSKFEGSLRQIRGEVLRQLLDGPKATANMGIADLRLPEVLGALVKEGFITERKGTFGLVK